MRIADSTSTEGQSRSFVFIYLRFASFLSSFLIGHAVFRCLNNRITITDHRFLQFLVLGALRCRTESYCQSVTFPATLSNLAPEYSLPAPHIPSQCCGSIGDSLPLAWRVDLMHICLLVCIDICAYKIRAAGQCRYPCPCHSSLGILIENILSILQYFPSFHPSRKLPRVSSAILNAQKGN